MSKRRKYDVKNKRSFIIIVVLSIAIIGIFSLFIYNYMRASKIEYVIKSGTVLQDVLKNYITVDDDAVLKVRWDGRYYLVYGDGKINLGKKVIVYNTITGGMGLYGNFYEITKEGKIVENKGETLLANTGDTKFYKLDDREYLLVDTKIFSNDNTIEANNYLLVELDKGGNAKLSNNKVNLKTISPTTLVSSAYTFDIANEILNFGDYDIDLKKIIGSTNEYVPDNTGDSDDNDDGGDNSNDDNVGNDTTGGSGNNGGLGIGTGTQGGVGDIVNENDTGNVPLVGELLDKIKMTSIIRVVEGLTQIDVDYVIYDPYNEYKSVYVELISPGKIDVVHLSKNDTHITLSNLIANTTYKLNFVYEVSKVNSETGLSEVVPYTFEQFELTTKMPEYQVSIYKISKIDNKLTYRVDLQSGFEISKINAKLSFNVVDQTTGDVNEVVINDEILVDDISGGYVLGEIDISGYDIKADSLLRLTVDSVLYDETVLPVNIEYTFRFGR